MLGFLVFTAGYVVSQFGVRDGGVSEGVELDTRSLTDPETVTERDWNLPAIERGNVHVLDDSLLNQPSPRLVAGIETLAAKLHPDALGSPGT